MELDNNAKYVCYKTLKTTVFPLYKSGSKVLRPLLSDGLGYADEFFFSTPNTKLNNKGCLVAPRHMTEATVPSGSCQIGSQF